MVNDERRWARAVDRGRPSGYDSHGMATSHAIAKSVRHRIYHAVPRVVDVVVHVDPNAPVNAHRSTGKHLPTVPRTIAIAADDRAQPRVA